MPNYCFLKEPLNEEIIDHTEMSGPDRIVVEHSSKKPVSPFPGRNIFGNFKNSYHFTDGKKTMVVGNCEGSLIVVDSTRVPFDENEIKINKLHIGELAGTTPHAEAYEHHGVKGVRVDLAEFDMDYASKMYRELVQWRDLGYRDKVRRKHQVRDWYSVRFRLAQLEISPEGLEQKISEVHNLMENLKRNRKRRFVSDSAKEIENLAYGMIEMINEDVDHFYKKEAIRTKRGHLLKREPNDAKIIINPDIFVFAQEINKKLTGVMEYICPQIDIQKAKNYWPLIESWSKI